MEEEESFLMPVTIYKKDSDRWPKDPSAKDILKDIKKGRYKLKNNGRKDDSQKVLDWPAFTRLWKTKNSS